ncbi:MAG: hypothetical protein HYS12_22230 [Planctomycetes bacterium]|nr:hypothetical protein [Planctomycetota bacterium]
MRRALFVVATSVLFAGLVGIQGHTAAAEKTETLMKRKLQHSQKVLEGVAVQDFKMIERHADELIQISKLAEWRAFKTPAYEVYSNDFRRIAGALAENARKKNIDAAALSYVDLTLTCVKCHKHVRELRMTSAD